MAARAYGAFNERFSVPNRHTIVLDSDAVVRDVIKSESMTVEREFDLYVAALENL